MSLVNSISICALAFLIFSPPACTAILYPSLITRSSLPLWEDFFLSFKSMNCSLFSQENLLLHFLSFFLSLNVGTGSFFGVGSAVPEQLYWCMQTSPVLLSCRVRPLPLLGLQGQILKALGGVPQVRAQWWAMHASDIPGRVFPWYTYASRRSPVHISLLADKCPKSGYGSHNLCCCKHIYGGTRAMSACTLRVPLQIGSEHGCSSFPVKEHLGDCTTAEKLTPLKKFSVCMFIPSVTR